MVRGLDVFQSWFADYADQYVLIGGTAASLTMEEAGLAFRATKDLDIVLHVEALTAAFGQAFWRFVDAGGYEIRQASDTGKPIFYRFQKPADDRYPAMVELFARARELERAVALGCWFSVGPAMLAAEKARGLARAMPKERVLTETDGPFAKLTARALNHGMQEGLPQV